MTKLHTSLFKATVIASQDHLIWTEDIVVHEVIQLPLHHPFFWHHTVKKPV